MSTRKTTAPGRAALPLAAPLIPLDALAEIPRQQAVVAAETACALFRGFESMRRIQEQAAHQALVRHGAVAEKLRSPLQPLELFALQANLARVDLDAAARYWQDLAAAALEMQTEMAGSCAHLISADAMLQGAHSLE